MSLWTIWWAWTVALRKESVDRNLPKPKRPRLRRLSLSARRAWIEILLRCTGRAGLPSLSARRAWIEMASASGNWIRERSLSARRAWIEIMIITESYNFKRSLSARRAWIEIVRGREYGHTGSVALRKESVDRNPGLLKF